MSSWWDEDKQRYRSSLSYKVFYVWGWPFFRWVMFHCMPSETAHKFALHFAIPFVGRIDRVGCCLVSVLALAVLLPLLLVIRLLVLLPWFTLTLSDNNDDPKEKQDE